MNNRPSILSSSNFFNSRHTSLARHFNSTLSNLPAISRLQMPSIPSEYSRLSTSIERRGTIDRRENLINRLQSIQSKKGEYDDLSQDKREQYLLKIKENRKKRLQKKLKEIEDQQKKYRQALSFSTLSPSSQADVQICSICTVALQNREVQTFCLLQICGHMFHTDCIEQWRSQKNTCPNCRKRFNQPRPVENIGQKYRLQKRSLLSMQQSLMQSFRVILKV